MVNPFWQRVHLPAWAYPGETRSQSADGNTIEGNFNSTKNARGWNARPEDASCAETSLRQTGPGCIDFYAAQPGRGRTHYLTTSTCGASIAGRRKRKGSFRHARLLARSRGELDLKASDGVRSSDHFHGDWEPGRRSGGLHEMARKC